MSGGIVGRNWVQRCLSVSRRVCWKKRKKKDKWFCIRLHLWPYNVSNGELPCWVVTQDQSAQWLPIRIPHSGKVGAAGLIPWWLRFWCSGGYFVEMNLGGLYFRYKPQLLLFFYFLFLFLFLGGWGVDMQAGAGLTRKWYLKSRSRLWQDHHISLSYVPLLHINDSAYLPPWTPLSYHLYLCQRKNFKIGLYIDNTYLLGTAFVVCFLKTSCLSMCWRVLINLLDFYLFYLFFEKVIEQFKI